MKSKALENGPSLDWSSRRAGARTRTQRARVRAVRTLVVYLMLLAVGTVFMLPLLWMMTTAIKPLPDIFKIPPVWLPNPPRWSQLWEPWRCAPPAGRAP